MRAGKIKKKENVAKTEKDRKIQEIVEDEVVVGLELVD